MGSGASSLTKEQSLKLTQTLKEKYERYKAAGESDEAIQEKLTKHYHEAVAELKISSQAPKMSTSPEAAKPNKIIKTSTSSSSSKLPGRASFEEKEKSATKSNVSSKLGAGSSKLTGGSTKAGATRRRSFDNNKGGGPTAAAVAAAQEALKKAEESTKSPAPADPPKDTAAVASPATVASPRSAQDVQADSWDSVTQQPYCNVCQMAFKSATFLERHVKFSDLHTKNVQKQKDANAQLLPDIGTVDEMFPVSQSGKVEAKQVEGKHYRLIYSGSKFFWRTQETLDINIYHHILPSTIEIISYDTAKAKELNRLYCDYTALCDLSGVTATAMASAGARAAALRAQAARELHAKSTETNAPIPDKAAGASTAAGGDAANAEASTSGEDEVSMLAKYIIPRLQLGPPANNSTLKRIEFVKLSSDTYTKSPVMDKVPVVLIPISVARRRRTNAEEIEQTMSSLVLDRAALAEATSHAHKVASVVYSASTSLAEKKWWADFNPVRRKWIWAIRRVIRQKLVAETKVVLSNLELQRKRQLKRQYTDGLSSKNLGGISPKGSGSLSPMPREV